MIEILVSGGQTGADRAALDVAILHGFAHGGWCPKGRLALDGVLGGQYQLRETPSARYLQRTEWNVRDTDATVVFTFSVLGLSRIDFPCDAENRVRTFRHLTYENDLR
jgi:hypothetical protein